MRKSLMLILLIAVQSCATNDVAPLDNTSGCWEFNTNQLKDISNTLSLCMRNDIASMVIYYPNTGDTPTKCFQEGVVHPQKTKSILVTLNFGACENGRERASMDLLCESKASFLQCVDLANDYRLKFERKNRITSQ